MVLSKKESCAALVVITLVLMAAASLLADPAWAQAELTVNKTGSPGTVEEGGEVTYTVVVTNTEDATADEVVIRDTLPPGARFISAETEDGTCTPPGSDPVVVCELGAIEAGESETVTIKARVRQTGTNQACAESTTVVPPVPPEEDCDTARTRVVPRLDIDKIDDRDPVNVGVTFCILSESPTKDLQLFPKEI